MCGARAQGARMALKMRTVTAKLSQYLSRYVPYLPTRAHTISQFHNVGSH
jgi:hypothetical protein